MTDNVIPITAGNQPAALPGMQPGVHTKDAVTQAAVADAVNRFTSPLTGLTGKPSTADFRDPTIADQLSTDIISTIGMRFETENIFAGRNNKLTKWVPPQNVPNHVIADLLVRTGDFATMMSADGTSARLFMRIRTGNDIGIHRVINTDNPLPELMLMITNLRPSVAIRDVKEIISRMACDIRLHHFDPQTDTDTMLVWCRNGIYNLHNGTFAAYDDPAFDTIYANSVSTWKLAVDYNPNANTMPTLKTSAGADWSWDKQLLDTFDLPGTDPAVRDASIKSINQLISLCIRGISGGMAVWFTNAAAGANGRNGKSTITEVLRQLLGMRNVMATAVEDLGERFALARLPYVAAIVSDETDADVKAVEKASAYKALVTGESVMVEEKQRTAYSYGGFHGAMVQAMNNVIKLSTSGGSLWRRILVIRFERNFELLGEAPEIKTDFVRRPEVLEAILYRALHTAPIERFTPDVVAALEPNKSDVRSQSSKVWAFMDDAAPLLKAWADMGKHSKTPKPFRLPLKLLYECYRDRIHGWSAKSGYDHPLSLPQFTADFIGWVGEHSAEWKFYDKSSVTALFSWVSSSEHGVSPLLYEYPAADWADDGSGGHAYRGIMRPNRFPVNARGVLEYIGT